MELLKKLKLDELSERDSIILAVGGVITSIIIIYMILAFFIFSPLNKEKISYQKNISIFDELNNIKKEFDITNGKYSKFLTSLPPKGADISSMVLKIAKSSKIESNVGDMKPLSRKVDDFKELSLKFNIDGINTEELVDFLYKLENDRMFLYISEINLEPKSLDGLRFLEATLKVKTYTQEKS